MESERTEKRKKMIENDLDGESRALNDIFSSGSRYVFGETQEPQQQQ